ncbi:MAG: DMT family transporter [Anaerolineae bacterium]|nr:DMT family transporter [Anaerolineae bacterium]
MNSQPSISVQNNSSPNLPIISTLLLLDSFHFVWARLLLPYISPRISALYVMAVATLIVGVYAFAKGQINFGVLRKHLGFFVLIGLLIAGSTNLSYIAIGYVDPGAATLLTQFSTPLSILIGVIWLKERFTRWQFVGAVLATLGVCIVALQPSDFFRIGSLLILCAVPLYTFHTALVKRNGDLDFVNFYFFRLLFTTAALFLFSAAQGAWVWPTPQAWPLLIATGAIDVAGTARCTTWRCVA